MKSFKCLCLKCTWLILLVLRSPHVWSVCMGVAVTSSLQHRDRKKPFFPLIALADCLFLLSLVQLKKKVYFLSASLQEPCKNVFSIGLADQMCVTVRV